MPEGILRRLLDRSPNSHKYDYGHVLVVGGSPGMVGAPFLCAGAALRAGAGLVTIASSPEVIDKLEKRVEEIMTLRLPPGVAADSLLEFIDERKVSVVAIGPGLVPETALPLLEILIKSTKLPVVIDGGALSTLSHARPLLDVDSNNRLVLTPHQGEFQRFFEAKLPSGKDELLKAAKGFVSKHKVILVLKGQPTFVLTPLDEIYENHSGGPGLATAGTGDVLTGIIAALLAQKIQPFEAAKAAVYLHGLAGDMATEAKTAAGVIASDVIEAIPAVLKTLDK